MMETVIAQITTQAASIGYGVIVLPRIDVKGFLLLMDGEEAAEGVYIQTIKNRKEGRSNG